MLDLIKKHLNDFAAGNWAEYRADLADDVIYDEVPTQQRVQGPDEYVNTVKRWKNAFPELRATVLDSVVSGDKGMVEVEWEGTHGGSLEAPFGTIPATNKKIRMRTLMFVRVANGKLAEAHHYFDLLTLMSQLGLAPGRPAPQPEARPGQAPTRT